MNCAGYIRNGFTVILFCLFAILLSGCASSQKHEAQEHKLAATHYQLGKDALIKGMLPKAFEELMKADKLHPNQPEVLDVLAYAWLLRGDLDKAEAHYKRALRYGAGSATKNNYANLLNKLQRFPEAEKMAIGALEDPRYPNQDLAFINLGDALLGQNKYSLAIQAYRQAQIFSPGSILPEMRIAKAYAKENRTNEAILLYRALYSRNNSNRAIVEGLLALLKQQGETTQARLMLKEFNHNATSALDKAWAMDELAQLK
ncbi:Tfp pilus assembly protein PilF [Mariprofundus ferrinatatus]|uniref:Tfp pilus assembly protein PilF n=1 Tax=Mariprofundus ferrinatatus TaxID=1921087 RepID=A0A2K8L3W8_9PROT|nr:tetratricopeptide repeat protein [Mariprofundus ferrinatatus]ATX81802.1 Tfp pilus assembly protein PilF [Mariprofundus ferrinatatus]